MAGTLNVGSLMVRLTASTTQFARGMRQSMALMDRLSAKAMSVGATLTKTLTVPMLAVGTASVAAFAQFDDAMTKSVAIMSDVNEEMRKEMEKTARTISSESVTSATELAEAYYFLASAGLSAEQSIASLATVERFAVAGAFDMAQATDLLTDAQSALGMVSEDSQQNMVNMTKLSDMLVGANTLANASVQLFSEALTNEAGAAIKQYNMDVEEGIAILAAYADQGLKGNVAGSMMARMTRLLIKSINENGEAFKKLNIDTSEFAATGKNITGVIDGITKAVDGMGPAQKAATLETLGFQARVQQAILPLLGGADALREYQSRLEGMGGVTQKVADKQLESFISQLKILWNNIVIAGQAIGEILAPYILALAEKVKAATKWFQDLDESTKKWIVAIGVALAALGPLLVMFGVIGFAISGLIGLVGSLAMVSWAAVVPWLAFFAAVFAVITAVTMIVVAVNWLTKSAFGAKDAFDSMAGAVEEYAMGIRTRFTILATYIIQAWDWVVMQSLKAWELLKLGVLEVADVVYQGMLAVARDISGAFWDAVGSALSALDTLVDKAGDAWFALTGKDIGGGLDDAIKSAKEQGELSGKFYTDALTNSLLEAEGKWMDYHNNVAAAEEDYANKVVDLDQWRGDLISKEHQKRQKEAEAVTKPPGMPDFTMPDIPDIKVPAMERSETEFKQVALNRISLAGLATTPGKEKEEVEDKGVADRLDEQTAIMKKQQGFALGY